MCIPRLWLLGVALLLWTPNTHSLTMEDIKDVLSAIVHTVRASDDKLARHEFREKALGEQLKKMLSGLDKKHRALEPLKGMISRLDERLSNVETILLQKEEREKSTQKKTQDALEGIQKTLEDLTKTITQNQNRISTAEIDNNLTPNEDILERRLDATDAKLNSIKMDIENLKRSFSNESLRSMCTDMTNVKPLEKHLIEAEKLLKKYELKLNEYNSTAYKAQTDIIPINEVYLADEAWHNKMAEVMERQEKEIVKIRQLLSDAESIWKGLPKLTDLQSVSNQTLQSIVSGIESIKENGEASVNKVTTKLREMGDRLVTTNTDIQQSLTQSNSLSEQAFSDISRSYDSLRIEVQSLNKCERIMLETADNIVATKKRIDYGVHEIRTEVSDLMKKQNKNLNRTVIERLDSIEKSVLNNHTEAYGNLSKKLENEISQVWGQMGIMQQQLLLSGGSIDKLSEQTGQYVNSSTATINKVKQEVDSIMERVVDLGVNLNNMFGRLSLTTQQFDRISEGLTDVLTSLKIDIQNVQAKMKDSGPGPHTIPATNGAK